MQLMIGVPMGEASRSARNTPEPQSLEPAERGNMLILGIGLWAVVCALLAGTVALTLVALERRELLAQADSIALAVADDLSDQRYYAGEDMYFLDDPDVAAAARSLTPSGMEVSEPTGMSDDTVVVTLSQTVPLAFVPDSMPFSHIELDVTTHARLRDR